MRQTFWVNGGDHGSVVLALEIVVAVWEMDRREEVGGVGLTTCVWSWASHSARPTPASGCTWAVSATLAMDDEDAEGLGCGEVGDDRTRGKEK